MISSVACAVGIMVAPPRALIAPYHAHYEARAGMSMTSEVPEVAGGVVTEREAWASQ
jgi:hypothetical protein